MSKFTEYMGSQFANPRGPAGLCSCAAMNIINRPMYLLAAELAAQSGARRLLDVGCGNGCFAGLALRRSSAELWGIDPSPDMLDASLQRNRAAVQSGRAHFSRGNCCSLRFPGGFFDAACSINTVYFWPDTLCALREVRRVLVSGGCFFNLLYTPDYLQKLPYTSSGFRFFTPEFLRELSLAAGFRQVEAHKLEKGKSFVVVSVK